jgi:glucose-6-phosphate 1-dehydrogenase
MPNAAKLEPFLLVVMGATGDLMRRKLLPAIYRLVEQGHMHDRFQLLGIARNQNHNDQSYQDWAREALAADQLSGNEVDKWCRDTLHYQSVKESDPKDYQLLTSRIQALEKEHNLPGNRVFYLAIPPGAGSAAVGGLGEAGLNQSSGWTRLVIEKPFGQDLASAEALNRQIHRYFDESQTYRIDHYLGKETVKNLLVFRFANEIFESVWNRNHIASVQITVAETVGTEGRGGYYEQSGALRDMVQSHLTQLMCLFAMESPAAFDAEQIRFEKIKVLRTVSPLLPQDVVFGQYTAGSIDENKVVGYRQETGVNPDSNIETFVNLRMNIENRRWQGVPFYLRTGKRLARHITQIAVIFREPPVCLFQSLGACQIHANVLLITLQPNEGFSLFFDIKAPEQDMALETLPLRFQYRDVFGALPDAYHSLLLDIVRGDQTLFVHAEEAEAAWRIYTPVLNWHLTPQSYPAGSWGPEQANDLLAQDSQHWF